MANELYLKIVYNSPQFFDRLGATKGAYMSENRQREIVEDGIERFLKLLIKSRNWYSPNVGGIFRNSGLKIEGELRSKRSIGTFQLILKLKNISSTPKFELQWFSICIDMGDQVGSVVQIDQEDLARFQGKEKWTITCAADLYRLFQTYDILAKLSKEPILFNLSS